MKAEFKRRFIVNAERSGWKIGTFSELVSSTLSGDWGKEEPLGSNTEKVYCMRGADIPEVKAGNKGKMPIRYILPKNYANKHLSAGDIVVEISGGSPTQSTGRCVAITQSLLNRYDSGMVCTNFCKAIKPLHGYSMFVYYYWQFMYEKRVFFSYENGTTGIKNLDIAGFLNNAPIFIPPVDRIIAFSERCKMMHSQIFANGKQSESLCELRDSLLPKLMSGEIDVSKIDLTQLNSHLLQHMQRTVHTVAIVLDERGSVETVINIVLSEMQGLLDPHQLKHLALTLRRALGPKQAEPGQDLLALFLTAKEVEGCSPKTIAYYEATLQHMNTTLAKPYTQVESDDLRRYLNDYELNRGSSKVTIDNIRRIMSSFFSWLEDEDYIVKSPVRRIRRVKTAQVTKEVLSDEELEVLRDTCESKRDLAIVDLLASTGMRIGELVRLDRKDVNLHERECLVMGKGNKQRPVYFDARAKLHLAEYLASRDDKSSALFVALDSSARRVTVGGVELRLRELGRKSGINRVHPHKFRRTLATHAIDKGMPIEQVQKLLGHAKIDTTMHYAMVNQSNVKASHRKYLE